MGKQTRDLVQFAKDAVDTGNIQWDEIDTHDIGMFMWFLFTSHDVNLVGGSAEGIYVYAPGYHGSFNEPSENDFHGVALTCLVSGELKEIQKLEQIDSNPWVWLDDDEPYRLWVAFDFRDTPEAAGGYYYYQKWLSDLNIK